MLPNQIFTSFRLLSPQNYILDSSKSTNSGMFFRSIWGTGELVVIVLEFHYFMISFTGVGSTGRGAIERLVTQVVYLSCWDAGRIHIDVSRQHLNMQVWSLGRKQSWRWTYRNYLHWGIFSWKCRDRSPPPKITYKYIFKGRSKFLKETYTLLLCSMVRGPAASVLPRNCLEMQSLQPHSRLCELEFVC